MEKLFSSLNVQTSSQAQPGIRGSPSPPEYNSLGIKLTVHLYLVLRLRMNGVTLPLPHVFTVFM
jgi:hypothetical protein